MLMNCDNASLLFLIASDQNDHDLIFRLFELILQNKNSLNTHTNIHLIKELPQDYIQKLWIQNLNSLENIKTLKNDSLFLFFLIANACNSVGVLDELMFEMKSRNIKFLTRDECIGQYVGWTGNKTTIALINLKGNLVFVNTKELSMGEIDSFGHEAIATIRNYISNNREENIFLY